MMFQSSRYPVLGALLLFVLAGCNDDLQPTSPDAVSSTWAAVQDERPFYYHQGERVYLDIDPQQIVVAGQGQVVTQAAKEVLRTLGLRIVDSKVLPQVAGYFVLRLPAGTTPGSATAATASLRADARVQFATVGYKVLGTNSPILLINRVNVEFKPEASRSQIDSLAAALGLGVERAAHPDSAKFSYWFTYPAGGAADPLVIAAQLDRHPLVKWADPDKVAEVSRHYTPSDPYFVSQYYLKNSNYLNGVRVDINVEAAWDLTRGGGIPSAGGITVAVIDDGVQAGHPDFGSQVEFGYDVFGNNSWGCYGCANNPDGNYSHGTLVAGIIVGQHDGYDNTAGGMAGIAPQAWIYPVRIFRGDGTAGTDAQIADGINNAWYFGAADVLNNSWGYPEGYAGNNAVTNAISNASTQGRGGKGSVVVFSAGNTSNRDQGYIGRVSYPATLTTVEAVGAINRSGGLTNYTPEGSELDLVALSGHYNGKCVGDVLTTDLLDSRGCNDGPNGDVNFSNTFSGTSAAAPQVAGVAALILSYEPSLLGSNVRSRLHQTVDKWGTSTKYGYGKVNAYRALTNQTNDGGGEPCEPIPPAVSC